MSLQVKFGYLVTSLLKHSTDLSTVAEVYCYVVLVSYFLNL